LILSKILKWVQLAIDTRVSDCQRRKLDEHNRKVARQKAIEFNEARKAKYNEAIEAAKEVRIKALKQINLNFRRTNKRSTRNTPSLTKRRVSPKTVLRDHQGPGLHST